MSLAKNIKQEICIEMYNIYLRMYSNIEQQSATMQSGANNKCWREGGRKTR